MKMNTTDSGSVPWRSNPTQVKVKKIRCHALLYLDHPSCGITISTAASVCQVAQLLVSRWASGGAAVNTQAARLPSVSGALLDASLSQLPVPFPCQS